MIHQIKPLKKEIDEEDPAVTHFFFLSFLARSSDQLHSSRSFPNTQTFVSQNSNQSKALLPSQETIMPSSYGVILSLILLLFLATVVTSTEPSLTLANVSDRVDEAPLVPLIEAQKLKTLVMNETRRRLGSFQICALCTCCGGAKGLCLPSPCCYAINCNIPNRPFGFCSFTPKTCNCFGCHY